MERLRKEFIEGKLTVPRLMVDNQSAIKLIKDQQFHKRTKHIDIKYHFIRDHYNNGEFDVMYISTKEQKADLLTKGLSRDAFETLRTSLDVVQNPFL